METRQIIILAIVIPLFLLFLWCLYWNQKRMRKRWKDSEEALKPFQDKCRDAITLKDVNNVWKDMDKLNYKDMHREEREKWITDYLNENPTFCIRGKLNPMYGVKHSEKTKKK